MAQLFKLARRRPKQSASLLARGTGWSKSEHFLNILSDGHRTEDVEEDERTFGVIFPGQIPVAQSLNPRNWHEG